MSDFLQVPSSIMVVGDSSGNPISGLSIGGVVDANLTVTLYSEGLFTLSETTGLTFLLGDGVNDGLLSFSGSFEDVNAALGALSYAPAAFDRDGDLIRIDVLSDQVAVTPFVASTNIAALALPSASFTSTNFTGLEDTATKLKSVGDINGDGLVDVFVETRDVNDYGYVIFGAAGTALADIDFTDGTPDEALRIFETHSSGGDRFWTANTVVALGDFNGDGIDDVMFQGSRVNSIDSGERYHVVYGSADLVGAEIDLAALDENSGFLTRDSFRLNATALGDINGDGLSDFGIGNPLTFSSQGRASIYYGEAGLPAAFDFFSQELDGYFLDGRDQGDFSGILSAIGDFNGDGIDDFAVGAREAERASSAEDGGMVSVIFGSSNGRPNGSLADSVNGANGVNFTGAFGEEAGLPRQIGDVNGDGLDDLLILAQGRSFDTAYVVFGSGQPFERFVALSDLDANSGFTIVVGNDDYRLSGTGIGDFNGDGFDDLVMERASFSDADGPQGRSISVVFGSADFGGADVLLDNLDGTNGFSLNDFDLGIEGLERLNLTDFTALGDMNGDGYADLGLSTATGAMIVYGRGEMTLQSASGTISVQQVPPGPLDWMFPTGFTGRTGLPEPEGEAPEQALSNPLVLEADYALLSGEQVYISQTGPDEFTGLDYVPSEEGFVFDNAGQIWIEGRGATVLGVDVGAAQNFVNSGELLVFGSGTEAGVVAHTLGVALDSAGPDDTFTQGGFENSGSIIAASFAGVTAVSLGSREAASINSGLIEAWSATSTAIGVQVFSSAQEVDFANTGEIRVYSVTDVSYNQFLRTEVIGIDLVGTPNSFFFEETVRVENSGLIDIRSDAELTTYGILGRGENDQVINSGTIRADVAIALSNRAGFQSGEFYIENTSSGVIEGDIIAHTNGLQFINAGQIAGNVSLFYYDPDQSLMSLSNVSISALNSGLIDGSLTVGNSEVSEDGFGGDATLTQSGIVTGDVILSYNDDVYDGAGGRVDGEILLGGGDDQAIGSALADTFRGGAGDDLINASDGDDLLSGDAGDDTLNGGEGSDTVWYESAIVGILLDLDLGAAQDGLGGADALSSIENALGGNFADTLRGDFNANALDGGDGDDTLNGRGGDDVLIGGLGLDAADYGEAFEGIVVNLRETETAGLATSTVRDGDGGIDTLLSIEAIIGSAFADTIYGGTQRDVFEGGAGADRIFGAQGQDVISGGLGADTLNGGGDFDTISYAEDLAGVTVNIDASARGGLLAGTARDGGGDIDQLTAFEFVVGTGFDDTIFGNDGRNTLSGGAGNDRLTGRAGDDTFIGGLGDDILNGQTGRDTADYSGASDEIDADLATEIVLDGDGGTDTLTGIEQIIGSDFSDVFTGGDINETIFAGSGNDIARGGLGNDSLYGEAGIDQLFGEDGSDRLYGGDNSDLLIGGAGVDILDGGAGNDRIEGGDDGDRIFARDGNDLIFGGDGFDIINGQEGEDEIYGGNERDILRGQSGNDEIYGDAGDDTLSGQEDDDQLFGGTGNDLLKGGSGNDALSGGQGDDRLIGGDGIDTAFFSGNIADYAIDYRGGVVRITDLVAGRDGFDKITEVETLVFEDGTIDVAGLG